MSSYPSSNYHPHISWFRQVLNVIGCLLVIPLYRAALVNTYYPATVELLLSVLLAEFCRFKNEGRRISFRESESQPRYKDDVEKSAALALEQQVASNCDTMAAVVGWREDPELWQRCLESYRTARGCKFLLAGVDGDDADDQEMVEVFKKVCRCSYGDVHIMHICVFCGMVHMLTTRSRRYTQSGQPSSRWMSLWARSQTPCAPESWP